MAGLPADDNAAVQLDKLINKQCVYVPICGDNITYLYVHMIIVIITLRIMP
jgi:hypothetical protein